MRHRPRAELLITSALVALGCLAAGHLLTHGATGQRTTPEAQRIPGAHYYAMGGHLLGRVNAHVTVVEFADFQCPFCRLMKYRMDTLLRARPQSVNLIYRHFPLISLHPVAFSAAEAAECASAQGSFTQFYDSAFAVQSDLPRLATRWPTFAAKIGVPDTAAFARCMSSHLGTSRVMTDADAAQRLQLQATPALLIGDELYVGALPLKELDSIVRQAEHHPTVR